MHSFKYIAFLIFIYLYIYITKNKNKKQLSIMTKANIKNVKRVLDTIVQQIIHITGSNNTNTYKLLPVSCFRKCLALHVK